MTCHYPDLGSDGSPVWNFCNHLGGNQWYHGERLAVFLGSHLWNYFINFMNEALREKNIGILVVLLSVEAIVKMINGLL